MFISGTIEESLVDGEGIRTVLFISGCKHECKNCHNKMTHAFDYGYDFTIEKQMKLIHKIKKNPLIDGVTISGGDAMYSPFDTIMFLKLFKKECPNLNVWIYTGFTWEQMMKDNSKLNVLKECDVLVDGLFVEELKHYDLKFRGSSNQRVINVKESFKEKQIINHIL